MNREKKLLKNTIIVALGQIGSKFSVFLLLPLYTSYLSTVEYGTVDLLNTYISLLLPIIFLQMEQAIFRFLIDNRNNEKEKSILISTVLLTVLMQAVLLIILFLIVGKFIVNQYKHFFVANVIASMFSSLLLQTSRGLGDNFTYSLGSIVSGVGTIILNILFIVFFKWGAYGMLGATFIANLLCAIFVFLKLDIPKLFSFKAWNKTTLKSLWKYSIPLVPNALSWWIISASDRTIVSHFLGVGINGIYSASNKFSGIIVTLFSIFNMTWTESASMSINDKDSSSYFTNIINTSIKLFSTICLLFIAIMPFVFSLLITGESFSGAYYQIPILIIATLFNIVVSLFGSIYVALKKSSEIAKTSIYSAIINISLNLLFIRFIGLYAASLSTLISYFSMTIYRYFDIQKYIKVRIDLRESVTILILSVITLLAYYSRNTVFCVLTLLFTIGVGFIINYKILLQLKKIVLDKFKK
ncbi:TPA: polysaccharide biosynthesis C-terminal domain-containing protein [Streptococcus suis]